MQTRWTFGQKLALGLTAKALITVVLAAAAVCALHSVTAVKDRVITNNARLLAEAYRLEGTASERMGTVRAYLLTGDQAEREVIRGLRRAFFDRLEQVSQLAVSPEERAALDQISRDTTTQFDAGDSVADMRQSAEKLAEVGKAFEERVIPLNKILRAHLADFVALEQKNLDAAKNQASEAARTAIVVLTVIACAGVFSAVVLVVVLTRMLSRQIGSAVQHIQNSSSELQAAANQQTTGAREQVAAMTEISTTINELMATARQIAESAQGVARIADSSSAAARNGDETVSRAHGEVSAIRKQVDIVVEHMLDLGKKSQQIGGILEIINELAEQTNILSINATIEAAGAGEAGRRFAVVADEIRKLADRVGGSTKEIRGLIDQIRAAVNAAVMATESGSKAVDAGTRQFAEVATVFRRITELLGTTAEAAKEIELSTKQQSSAVEQTNAAIANVAQTSREAEAGSNQVLQTVAELTALSRDLGRLIRPHGQG
ncbi:MAG: methyl-accepting chemotaxis protein [Limisphaerales bacterium]